MLLPLFIAIFVSIPTQPTLPPSNAGEFPVKEVVDPDGPVEGISVLDPEQHKIYPIVSADVYCPDKEENRVFWKERFYDLESKDQSLFIGTKVDACGEKFPLVSPIGAIILCDLRATMVWLTYTDHGGIIRLRFDTVENVAVFPIKPVMEVPEGRIPTIGDVYIACVGPNENP